MGKTAKKKGNGASRVAAPRKSAWADLKLAAKIALHVRNSCERFFFDRGRLADIVVKASDQDASALVPHRIHEMCQPNDRIGNPVPVMSVVKALYRTVNG